MVKDKIFITVAREGTSRGIWSSPEQRESSKQNMASRLGLARRNSSRGQGRGVRGGDKERTKRGHSQNSRVIRRVRSWKLAVEGGEKSWGLGILREGARRPESTLVC